MSPNAAPREAAPGPRRRLLDPIDRISEILFGLIMTLTFTGSLSAAGAGREEVRTMMFGALGCNLAWALVDSVMYLMTSLTERGRALLTLRELRQARDDRQAHGIIADALPAMVGAVLPPDQLEAIRRRLNELPEPPARARLGSADYLAALAVFAWVLVATFPVVIPFIFMRDALLALRISNGIAIGMLFVLGYALGRYASPRPWLMGLVMVVLGSVLVGLTIALGG